MFDQASQSIISCSLKKNKLAKQDKDALKYSKNLEIWSDRMLNRMTDQMSDRMSDRMK